MKYIILSILGFLSIQIYGQNAQLKGTITDAVNNEPIPFANILVIGTDIGSTTDFDGNFTITGLTPGYIKLRTSFVGYKTKFSEDILVRSGSTPYIEITLEQNQAVLDEIVITANPFEKKDEALLSIQSIGVKEIESNPGSNRDISRVIQSFPGVGSTPAFRNDIIIRGGGPSESRFFLDDVEIPVLNHFSTQGASGGPVGIINADFIRNVDFYSASFPASKYNALSGVFDFKQKDGGKDKTNLQFTLGASEIALTVDGPIGEKTNYIFSVRRSYLQFLFSALELPFLPTYNDYQLRVKTNFDTKNSLTIISIGSLDNLTLNDGIKNPDPSQEYILGEIPVNDQWSYTIGGVYKHFFKNGYHTIVLSRNMLNNQFNKYPDNDESLEKSFDYISTEAENKFRYDLKFNKGGFKYNLSSNLENAEYTNQTGQLVYIEDSLINLQYNTQLGVFKYGLSAQVSKQLFKSRLLLTLGIRFDGNNYNSGTLNLFNQTSPRFSLSYALTEKLALNAGIGRYFQQPAYTTMGFKNNSGELVNKETVKYIGMNQYNLGTEYKFNDKVLLSVEGFYKDYFQYPIDVVTGSSLANSGAEYSSILGATPAEFTGEGKATGFEILNRWNMKSFTILASYTYVRSLFTDINNEYIPSSWDSKNLLTITGSKEFKKNWRFGLKYRFVGGLPYTPYDMETSSYVEAWDASGGPYLDYSQLNGNRLANFSQLDARVDKNFFFNKWALMLYVDIQNILNTKYMSQDIVVRQKNLDGTYKTINNETQYVLEELPNESGTVLPTIGIIIKI